MANLDLFYEAADRTTVTHLRTSGTISGATELKAEGTDFTLLSAPSPVFVVGQRVLLYDGVLGLAFCVIKKVTDSTHITLLPLQSGSDTVALPYTFPNASVITVLDEVAGQQVIDLSEAPADAYEYLLVVCGTLGTSVQPGDVDAYLRVKMLQDDPYSGSSGYGACRVEVGSSRPDRVSFVAATKVSLDGGQRYENALGFNGLTVGATANVANPRILALRVTGGYFDGDGKTAEQITNEITYQDYLDLGADLPAGDYLIACTWAAGANGGVSVDVILEADASTVLCRQREQSQSASHYIPAGFFGIVTLGGTNRVRLRFRGNLGFNSKIKNAFLGAVPVANIPALAAIHQSQDLGNEITHEGTINSFEVVKTSDPVTLESGRHIEIVAASVGADDFYRARPSYEAAGAGLGVHSVLFSGNEPDYHPTFWFIRNRRTAGETTNALEMRRNTTGTVNLKARDFTFSWLREQPDFRPLPNEKVAVVADIEMGGRVYKAWNSTTTVRRYSHRIADYDMMSRVRVSGSEYARVYSLAALVDGAWFWDAAASNLYIQLTTAHAAIGDPSSDALHVVVVPLLLAGRAKHVLVDSLGVRWPYRPLIKAVPTTTQSVRSNRAKFATGSTLGLLRLAMAHGEFDDKLFRSNFSSYRAKIRRGFPRKSNRLEDFEVVTDAIIEKPGSDFENLSFKLLDRRRLLQTPVANTQVTVREGYGGDARIRENQEIPIVWGETLGLVAYRLTANEGGSDWNEYQFCDHAVKSVTNVWTDSARRNAVAGGNKDVTAAYIGVGKVRVNNAAFDEPTQPPDVVYVDLGAGRTSDGTVSGTALHTPGAIARDLVVTYGGTPATRLIEKTFRMIDRRWRWQQIEGGGGRRPVPPRIGLLVSGKTSVEEALTKLCGDTVAYWIVNHQDRVGLDVPDFDRGLLTRNHGFEDDATSAYPWTTLNGATLTLTTARKYEGARSAEISNGSTPNAEACAAESILLSAGEIHAVTLVASLLEGAPDQVRIGVVGPSGVETLSEPMPLGTGRWSRHSLVYESETGDAGFTELRLYPAHGSTVPTRIAVDNVEVYPVACVTDRVRSIPRDVAWEDEHYYECTVPYGVNLQDAGRASRRKVGESEARGLSSAIESEGKFAIQSSTRADLKDTRAADGESAGGLAAPVPLQYSRQRPVLTIDAYGLERIPVVGDYAFHRLNPRIPESADEYPIWRIASVGHNERDAKVVKLKVRRQLDPIIDRIDIAPDNVPMGASAPTLDAGSITDYAEVTALQGQFLMGANTPDLVTQWGDVFHRHRLDHVHPLPLHDHVATLISHGIDTDGPPGASWDVKHDGKFEYPAPVGPQELAQATRGLTDGGHSHPVPGTPANVGQKSGTSSPPNATLETSPGPNEPSFRRIRVMQRTANTVETIDPKLIVGFRTKNLPAGWTRVTALDGMFLRVAGTLGALNTTTTATFTPDDAGSALPLTSGTGAVLGRRLTVVKSGSTVHVVITVENGANPTVVPLHETDDVDNASFPTGSAATVTADSELVNQVYAAPTHKHGGAMPSHQHAAGGHEHDPALFILGFAGQGIDAQKFLSGMPQLFTAALDAHTHLVDVAPPPANDDSGTAAGTISDDLVPSPPFIEIVWAVSDGNQRTIPAGGILLWTQSGIAPGGWGKIGEAKDLLLKGAAAGQDPVSGVGGHVHTQSNSAHTMAHAHGATLIDASGVPDGGYESIGENSLAGTISVAAGSSIPVEGGHAHDVTASLSSTDPGLDATGHATGPALLGLPRHKKVVLIEKL